MNLQNELFFDLVERHIADGLDVELTLKGVSMRPTLQPGDVLTLSPLRSEPQVGDIVLFRQPGRHVLHRVIAVTENGYLMQGDNAIAQELARRQDVVARLVSVSSSRGSLSVDSPQFRRRSRRGLRHRHFKCFVFKWLSRSGRIRLRPWYFVFLALLMWAPIGGLDVPLNNYVFGIRLDHLLHASAFLLCPLFMIDMPRSRKSAQTAGYKSASKLVVWLAAVGVGLFTEAVQYLLPYRGFDVNDLIANSMGVTVGLLAIVAVRGVMRRRAQ